MMRLGIYLFCILRIVLYWNVEIMYIVVGGRVFYLIRLVWYLFGLRSLVHQCNVIFTSFILIRIGSCIYLVVKGYHFGSRIFTPFGFDTFGLSSCYPLGDVLSILPVINCCKFDLYYPSNIPSSIYLSGNPLLSNSSSCLSPISKVVIYDSGIRSYDWKGSWSSIYYSFDDFCYDSTCLHNGSDSSISQSGINSSISFPVSFLNASFSSGCRFRCGRFDYRLYLINFKFSFSFASLRRFTSLCLSNSSGTCYAFIFNGFKVVELVCILIDSKLFIEVLDDW